jgi:hypothetical protein
VATATQLPPQPDLLEEIQRRRAERLASRSRAYARSVPIASDIDPASCLRRQVLEIVRWEDKPLPDARLQGRFEVGERTERDVIIDLKRDGFDVEGEQTAFELRRRGGVDIVLRGRIDGKIRWGSERVPFEVKSLMPAIFDRVQTIADFDRYWWTRKYPYQLQSYLIGHGHPWGFFAVSNLLGEIRLIRVELDYDLAERLWAFAEQVAAAVHQARQDGTLPTYTSDPTECAHCPFFGRTCNPDIVEQGARFLSDPELVLQLERWAELKPAASEHAGLDKRLKERIRATGIERALAGDFAITVTPKPVKAYEVKARVDQVVKIERLGSGAGEDL